MNGFVLQKGEQIGIMKVEKVKEAAGIKQ